MITIHLEVVCFRLYLITGLQFWLNHRAFRNFTLHIVSFTGAFLDVAVVLSYRTGQRDGWKGEVVLIAGDMEMWINTVECA